MPREDLGEDVAYNLRFPGQVFDGQAGLHQNGFRDYDPAAARYIESDPIGLKGGINTYNYVNNRPTLAIDPNGLSSITSSVSYKYQRPLPGLQRGALPH